MKNFEKKHVRAWLLQSDTEQCRRSRHHLVRHPCRFASFGEFRGNDGRNHNIWIDDLGRGNNHDCNPDHGNFHDVSHFHLSNVDNPADIHLAAQLDDDFSPIDRF